jgi:hypothetical protein
MGKAKTLPCVLNARTIFRLGAYGERKMRFLSHMACMALISVSAFGLSGCSSMYGTPYERAAQNSRSSSYSLCSRFAQGQMAPDVVREEWAQELQRRSENCSQYSGAIANSIQQGNQQMQTGLQLLSQPNRQVPAMGGGTSVGVAFLKRNYQSGFNRVCIYDRLGSEVAVTIGSTALCPQSLQ